MHTRRARPFRLTRNDDQTSCFPAPAFGLRSALSRERSFKVGETFDFDRIAVMIGM
jgi:hypothetical protein